MNILDRIWLPTQKDRLAGLQQRRYSETFFLNAAQPNFLFNTRTVSPDTVRIITTICCVGAPGAAQFWDSWQWFVGSPSLFTLFYVGGGPKYRIANVTLFDSWESDGLAMFPGEGSQFQINFNAGVANNGANASIYGWEIPRANLL